MLCKDPQLDKSENRGLRELVEQLFEQDIAND